MTSSDLLISQLVISLDSAKTNTSENPLNEWYSLESGSGLVHVEMQYNYHYSRVINFL